MNSHTENKEYLIEYNEFKGPIYLLLELVQKRKKDIYEISLSTIIRDFVNYTRNNENILIDTLSGFTYISSILLEIKSRSLLPSRREKVTAEENEPGIDILKLREKEYNIFKKVSDYFRELYEEDSLYYIREAPLEKEFLDLLPDFADDLNLEKLVNTASGLLKHREEKINLKKIYNSRVSISIFDEMERIKKIVEEKGSITFKEVTSEYKEVIDKIVSFLSILELYKKGIIDIIQFEYFGSIIIKKLE
ncbi:MAG: segregation/condensation protein A [Actinomycetota bacterium]|nr:segregation/condensation protein A [Actinomycetota bacterium]MDD5600458.1 segregation/condensation protein A [Actinomycetota bacterium]